MAARETVQENSTLKLLSLSPSAARRSRRGVIAPRTPP
jgi:hypothetical protein